MGNTKMNNSWPLSIIILRKLVLPCEIGALKACFQLMEAAGRRGGMKNSIDTSTLPCVVVSGSPPHHTGSWSWCSAMTQRGGRGGATCLLVPDSCCCAAETDTTLKSNYTPIHNNSFSSLVAILVPLMKYLHPSFFRKHLWHPQNSLRKPTRFQTKIK